MPTLIIRCRHPRCDFLKEITALPGPVHCPRCGRKALWVEAAPEPPAEYAASYNDYALFLRRLRIARD